MEVWLDVYVARAECVGEGPLYVELDGDLVHADAVGAVPHTHQQAKHIPVQRRGKALKLGSRRSESGHVAPPEWALLVRQRVGGERSDAAAIP